MLVKQKEKKKRKHILTRDATCLGKPPYHHPSPLPVVLFLPCLSPRHGLCIPYVMEAVVGGRDHCCRKCQSRASDVAAVRVVMM